MENQIVSSEQERKNIVQTKQLKDMTNTQSNFLDFIISHKEEMNKIGDLESIFKAARDYWKDR